MLINNVKVINMEKSILFEKKIGWKGSALAVSLTKPLMDFIEVGEGDDVVIGGDSGKHGKYLFIYKKEVNKNVD